MLLHPLWFCKSGKGIWLAIWIYLITSCSMWKATTQDVYANFKEYSISQDDKSTDGPNVNLNFLNLMRENRKENNLPELLEIETRGLHIVRGIVNMVWMLQKGTSIIFFLPCGRYLINLLPGELILNPRLVETIGSSYILIDGLKELYRGL